MRVVQSVVKPPFRFPNAVPSSKVFTRFENDFLYTAAIGDGEQEEWSRIDVEKLLIADLIPTQRVAEHSHRSTKPISVVRKKGRLYVVDGHNRLAAAIQAGQKYIRAHVLELPDVGATPEYMAAKFGARAVRESRTKGVWRFDW